jgi:hypothetical protein
VNPLVVDAVNIPGEVKAAVARKNDRNTPIDHGVANLNQYRKNQQPVTKDHDANNNRDQSVVLAELNQSVRLQSDVNQNGRQPSANLNGRELVKREKSL